MTMKTWSDLALTEWRRAFRWRRAGGGTGRRDFFWLTILLFLTLALALLLWGTKQGLLNQFMNVSLGYIEGAGVPLWLVSEVGGLEDNLIDRQMMERMMALGIPQLSLHPYREVEPNEVALPGHWQQKEVWRKGEAFIGRAVESRDPLWSFNTTAIPGAPDHDVEQMRLEVLANETLFWRNFNCTAYHEALLGQVPEDMLTVDKPQNVPDSIPPCLGGEILWLDIKIGRERELVPFAIRWQKNIPAMQQLALLMPLGVLHAIRISRHNLEFRYRPEDTLGKESYVTEIQISPDEEGVEDNAQLELLASCLGSELSVSDRLRLKLVKSQRRVDQCAAEHGFRIKRQAGLVEPPYLQITGTQRGHTIYGDDQGYITLACSGLNSLFRIRIEDCNSSDAENGRIHATDLLNGYPKVVAYLPRSELFKAREALTAMPKYPGDTDPEAPRAVYIHDSYEDALIRFSFINEVMKSLESSYAIFFGIFLAVLLWVQVGVVVSHRRHLYGIFLAKGLSWGEIRKVLLLQITLSFGVGLAGAVAVVGLMSYGLRLAIITILGRPAFSDRISSDLYLLPLSFVDFLMLAVFALAISLLIGAIHLFLLIGSAKRAEPADLLQT
ncbi:MAG: ABC transporter permease [bacterium]|nr:ABC transporter permease [bacterium]